jgi:hypothetical protein
VSEAEPTLAEGVACERTYQIIVDGSPQPLHCRWFVPEPHSEGGWECRRQITWPDGRTSNRRTGGVDSTQALMLALSSVGADLLASDDPVYWFDPNDDLGLPMLDIVVDDVAERKARFEGK